MLPALDVMKEYLGLLFAFPEVVDVHRGAVAKVKECEKMKEECRIDVSTTRGPAGGGGGVEATICEASVITMDFTYTKKHGWKFMLCEIHRPQYKSGWKNKPLISRKIHYEYTYVCVCSL